MDESQPTHPTPQERAAAIRAAEGPRLDALVAQAAALVQSNAPIGHKAARMVQIADGLSRAITPHVECRNGCSHCCSQPVGVSGYEVRAIERYTGRKAIMQGRAGVPHPELPQQMFKRFTGVPCTFLAEGRCTIYPVRPIACRLHHSLMPSAEPCDTVRHPEMRVKSLNLRLDPVLIHIFRADDRGDIREFFPPPDDRP
ncbi:MAG TPA: YkgJ family cysteine cluster protein [Usitatibacter sp.]|nr:YkgJ family cysteine cluster protein [Usitatibacter sp.]